MAASRRDQYFNPAVTRGQGVNAKGLVSVVMPNIQAVRNVVSALKARAMLLMGEGVPDAAWEDLLAAHRLARFVSRGVFLVDLLVGIAMERHVSDADEAYLESCRLSSRQLRRRLQDLQNLPPRDRVADKIDLGERACFLDSLRRMRQGQLEDLSPMFPKVDPLTDDQKRELANFDWVEIQRGVNRWHDRTAAVSRLADRPARLRDWTKLKAEFAALKGPESGYRSLQSFLFEKAPGKNPSEAFRDRSLHLISGLMVSIDSSQRSQDRVDQFANDLRIGIAVVIYHREHKRFPQKLEDLVPSYLPSVPMDLFSGKPLVYRSTAEGFVVYSVGENGKDDGGRGYGEGADDLRFRITKLLPALVP